MAPTVARHLESQFDEIQNTPVATRTEPLHSIPPVRLESTYDQAAYGVWMPAMYMRGCR